MCQNVEKSNTSFPLRSLTKSFETIKSHLEDCPLDQSKRSKTSAHPVSSQLTILKAKKAKTLVITFLVLFFPRIKVKSNTLRAAWNTKSLVYPMTPENTRPLRRPKTLLKHKVLLNGQLSWNNHNKSAPDLHFTLDEGCRNIKGMAYLEQC